MSSWHWYGKDDGRSGLEWAVKIDGGVYWVWIPGTDHPDDVLHHRKVRRVTAANGVHVTKADLLLAADIVRELDLAPVDTVYVGGHSWGGGLAALIVWIYLQRGVAVRGFLYAPKQVGNRAFVDEIAPYVTAYRHRGDWIPLLQFWLALFRMHRIGRMTWPWKAHLPPAYRSQMEADGFR